MNMTLNLITQSLSKRCFDAQVLLFIGTLAAMTIIMPSRNLRGNGSFSTLVKLITTKNYYFYLCHYFCPAVTLESAQSVQTKQLSVSITLNKFRFSFKYISADVTQLLTLTGLDMFPINEILKQNKEKKREKTKNGVVIALRFCQYTYRKQSCHHWFFFLSVTGLVTRSNTWLSDTTNHSVFSLFSL